MPTCICRVPLPFRHADIIFYGERLPAAFHASRVADLPQADLLLIIGTSLSVEPFASVIGVCVVSHHFRELIHAL
jgi:NAD+-dependent protein deacetylase sirtuin 2